MEVVLFFLITVILASVVYYCITVLSHHHQNDNNKNSSIGNSLDDFILCKTQDCHAVAASPLLAHRDRGIQVRILYGTEYGASEEIARKLNKSILESSELTTFSPRIINLKYYSVIEWEKENMVLFIISTSGDGVPPTDARPFMEYLHKSNVFINISYSVLALGDSNYPHYCRTGKELDQRLQYLNARKLIPRHDVDMEQESVITAWLDAVLSTLKNMQGRITPTYDYLPPTLKTENEGFSRDKPFWAAIKNKRMLTVSSEAGNKETFHIEFDLQGSELIWESGDALGVYPMNSKPEVRALLHAAQLSGDEQVLVRPICEKEERILTLKEALECHCNLKDCQMKLVYYLSVNCTCCRIESILADGCNKNNIQLLSYLKTREIRDVLQDFKIKLEAQNLVNMMKPLQARFYSISSSPVKNNCSTASLTIAAVKYSNHRVERTGVCSIHLLNRCAVGEKLPVFISRNPNFRLPSNGYTDIIMIGPGTGLAPFMAFISERLHCKATGKMLLYFGCRNNKDFIYREQLEQWHNKGNIELYCALSRECSSKVYVQHLMKARSSALYQLLNDGCHVYVCGDARHMAADVHQTLVDICSEQGEMTSDQAQRYMNEIAGAGRYQRDVWTV